MSNVKLPKVHKIKAHIRQNPNDTKLFLDGQPLKGCSAFKIEADTESYPLVTLTLRADVELGADIAAHCTIVERVTTPKNEAKDE